MHEIQNQSKALAAGFLRDFERLLQQVDVDAIERIYQILRGRVVSLILVVGLGFLLMLSMIVASAIGAVGRYLERYTALSELTVDLLNFGLSFALLSLLFAAIYKLLPNKRLALARAGNGSVTLRCSSISMPRPYPCKPISCGRNAYASLTSTACTTFPRRLVASTNSWSAAWPDFSPT